ncbi:outer membrane protein assembly factor [Deinococcus cellulosilyticus NBRC 106333 = KACC 11606]|uniref:Outer membrane protein assembly factor n=2 Tax=Deinococcus cellulosilyticus TaxID=401558 RepID=A0A511N8Y6_DEIC1|nr:outer membrane protein assembly factor [Deinococcus cellulosilyticus NBRC 106333 = KACC 11606]
MRKVLTVTMLLASPTTIALAQTQDTLQAIQIVGVTGAQEASIKSRLPIYVGSKVTDVKEETIRAAIARLGTFTVTSVTVQNTNTGPVLRIEVRENPKIADIVVTGSTLVDPAAFTKTLQEQYGISKGAQLNTSQLELARARFRQALRDLGLPFLPEVTTAVQEGPAGATITFNVQEAAPVRQVVFQGLTRLPQNEAQAAFADLLKQGTFSSDVYEQSLRNLSEAYQKAGYLGSGADLTRATLNNGILSIPVVELTIGSIDTSLVTPAPTLNVKEGAVFRPSDFNADLQRISEQLGKTVTLQYQQSPSDPTRVDVQLVITDIPAGKIQQVTIEGNTAIPDETLIAALKSKVGQTFSLPQAQEDLLALQRAYREKGFDVVIPENAVGFDGKVLTFKLTEVTIGGYDIKWEGAQRTNEDFVRSQLPAVGSALNADTFRKYLGRLVQGGVVKALNVQPVPTDDPSKVRLAITLQDVPSLNVSPGLTYAPGEGFAGDLQVTDTNLFGIGHQLSASLNFTPNEARQVLGGSVSYGLPYLGTPEQPISGKVTVSSNVTPNVDIKNGTVAIGRQYTERNNQLTVEAATPLNDNVSLSGGVQGEIKQYFLEPGAADSLPDSDPAVTQNLPGRGWTVQAFSSVNADYADSASFPTTGFRASVNASYGFGFEKSNLNWGKVAGGLRGYVDLTPGAPVNLVLAGRVDAGTIIGTAPESALFRVGGSQFDDRFSLKGFDEASFTGKNFFTAGVEARADFGLKTDFLQGMYALGFVDAGDAWTQNDFNMNVGYGLGIQANLGPESFVIPVRMDYAFSNLYPRGKFSIKLGFLF